MNVLAWRGPPPPPSLLARLTKEGWALRDEGAKITVLFGPGARLRAPKPGGWLWLSPKRVGAAELRTALELGAQDAFSTQDPGWEARLLRRLGEAQVDEPAPPTPRGFVAQSAAAKALLWKIAQAARTSMPVLLIGETGTGKELAARLIHEWSSRGRRTFVPINCAAIPNELMEGELFGYAKGAFSGATRSYDGLVSAAEGGTVFLDEIDDTPYALQQKLLRVLEDGVVSKLGESVWRKVDFRILAATNRNLRALIERGSFGEDLYERLATMQLELPPLRERLEDFEPLVLQLIERYYAIEESRAGRPRVLRVTPEALEVLRGYGWPGNVRELRNVIFGALVVKRSGEELLASDLPKRLWKPQATDGAGVVSRAEVERRIASGTMNLRQEVERLERLALELALQRAGGNAAEAARLLGEVGRGAAKDPGGTVRTMIKRLGLTARG